VQVALEDLRGVKDAKVSLRDDEVVVTYDPTKVKVEEMVTAVNQARGMSKYEATVKK
jgi:copper chaperone CopZ